LNALSVIDTQDLEAIEEILKSTDFFYDFEIATALEIADETIKYGAEISGYFWVKITEKGKMIAFANYGKNDFSVHSWELYWIAVHQNLRHKNIGTILLKAVEEDVIKRGGRILWIETSGRPLYTPTEKFYTRNGYELAASLKDFYAPGDPKQIYSKTL
jgi:GNAT superfamily N-acetyltransferase